MRKTLIRIKDFFVLLFKFTTTKPVYYCSCQCHLNRNQGYNHKTVLWCEHCNSDNAISKNWDSYIKRQAYHNGKVVMETWFKSDETKR